MTSPTHQPIPPLLPADVPAIFSREGLPDFVGALPVAEALQFNGRAISLAAAYLKTPGRTWEAYLTLVEEVAMTLRREDSPSPSPESVAKRITSNAQVASDELWMIVHPPKVKIKKISTAAAAPSPSE